MNTLTVALRPVLADLVLLTALAAPAVYGLARRPRRSERLLTVPFRPWVRISAWVLLGLLVWAGTGRLWLGIFHADFGFQSSVAGAAVKLGVAAVLLLHYASATLVAGPRGIHWFSFFRRWRDVASVPRTQTGVRFRIDGRPDGALASVLDDSLWSMDERRWELLRSLVHQNGPSTTGQSPGSSPPGEYDRVPRPRSGRETGRRGGPRTRRRPLPTASPQPPR